MAMMASWRRRCPKLSRTSVFPLQSMAIQPKPVGKTNQAWRSFKESVQQ